MRRTYGVHADEVLGAASLITALESGFELRRSADGTEAPASTFHMTLPRDGADAITFALTNGQAMRVREVGARGQGERVEGAVSYARDNGRVYWTESSTGYEEWLDLEAGEAFAGKVVARWDVEGASLRMAGGQVVVSDETGAPRMVVSAPRAWARSGRPVDAKLAVEGKQITLSVDADGEAVLVDPSWVGANGNMANTRLDHMTIQLADGKVLVAGGRGTSIAPNNPYSSAEVFNPVTGTFSTAGTMSAARRLGGIARLNDGRVIVVGGVGVTGTTTIYTPGTNSWGAGPTMPSPIVNSHWHTATTLTDGRVLVAGGDRTGATPALAEAYLLSADGTSWSTTTSLVTARRHHRAVRLDDGRVMVVGGIDNTTPLATSEIYDPATPGWTQQTMNGPHDFASVVKLPDGRVLVFGGMNTTTTPTAACEIWSPMTGLWTSIAPMPVALHNTTATVLPSGRVAVTGGQAEVSPTMAIPILNKTAALYDPVANTWTPTPNTAGVHGSVHGAALLPNGTVLLVGGTTTTQGNGGAVDTAEILIPTDVDGTMCDDNGDCTSGFCTDGVCCNVACAGGTMDCQACSVAAGGSVDGTCGARTNGLACEDGSACTSADTCSAGTCMGNNPVVCTPLDQCHDAGVCNPGTGMCSNPNANNGTACNDGDLCTLSDSCTAGACQPGTPVTCTASDQCHVAGVCNPGTGMCTNPNKMNGSACNDANACTQTDQCQSGACTGFGDPCFAPTMCTNGGASFTCGACPAGTFSPSGTGVTACTACSSGTFSGAGATSCAPWATTCTAGQFVATNPSATSDRVCSACPSETFSVTSNAAMCTAWTSCVPGTHVNTNGSATTNRTCSPCAAGTFSATSNAATCATWSTCASGEYEASAGTAAADRSCATCTVCTGGSTQISACTATADTVCSALPDAGTSDAGDAGNDADVADAADAGTEPHNGGGCSVIAAEDDAGALPMLMMTSLVVALALSRRRARR